MIGAIVADIEGTVGALQFVKRVLFPYAERRLAEYVRAHRGTPEVTAILDATARSSGHTSESDAIDQLLAWSRGDQKIAPLKDLQGLIWRDGYESGELRAHIYPDAQKALERWHAAGVPLFVYSSGSVMAQHLYFRFSEGGDLSRLFTGYFDTGVGPKRSAASYGLIAERIAVAPSRLLFLSDTLDELEAARASGWKTCWVQRSSHAATSDAHQTVTSFDAVSLTQDDDFQ